jgi:DNA-binding NtrC family response regulator
MTNRGTILFIIDHGGYPVQHIAQDLLRDGYTVSVVHSMRKALTHLKAEKPDVIVAEFNYTTHFRDRVSNLEPLFATLQRANPGAHVITLLDAEHQVHLDKLRAKAVSFESLAYPLDMATLKATIQRACTLKQDTNNVFRQ